MRLLTFQIRCQFHCDGGSVFSWTFEESAWVMPDAEHTVVNGEIVHFTPLASIERAYRIFISGLTDCEKSVAAESLRIEARQVTEPERL